MNDNNLIKFINDFLKYSPSSIIPSIVGFITIPLLTQLFSPYDYGNFNLVMGVVGFMVVIINSIWGTPIIRFFLVSKKEGKLKQFYDTLFGGYIISTVILVLAIGLIINFFTFDVSPDLYQLVLIGIPLFFLTGFFSILRRLLAAKEKSGLYSIFTVTQSILGFLVGVLFVLYLKTGISGFLWGYIISFVIIMPFMYYLSFDGIYLGRNFSKSNFVIFMKYGIPLLISSLSAWILSVSDRFILNFYKGAFEVGIYSASYVISEYTLTIIWTLFQTASYPLIVKMWELKGSKDTQDYITELSRYFILIAFPAATGLSVFSKDIVQIIAAPSYISGYVIIPFVSFGAFFLGLQWWAQLGLLLKNKTHYTGMMAFIACISNIILNLVFIPKYGFFGAAVSTFLSYLIFLLVCMKISNQFLKWNVPHRSFFNIIVSSGVMFIILYLGKQFFDSSSLPTLILEALFGVVIYSGILLVMGEFKKEEISKLLSIFPYNFRDKE